VVVLIFVLKYHLVLLFKLFQIWWISKSKTFAERCSKGRDIQVYINRTLSSPPFLPLLTIVFYDKVLLRICNKNPDPDPRIRIRI